MSRALLVAGILSAQLALADAVPRVAVIKSSSVGPFNEATDAIVESLRGNPLQPEILIFDLAGDEARSAAVLAEARGAAPQLLITVGSLATAAAVKEPLATPVVFSMVLYPHESGFLTGAARHVTGVSLDIPLDLQFQYLRRLLPAARRVGVLYHPVETGPVVDEARKAAAAHAFDLVGESVDDPSRATAVFGAVMDRVDVMWSVADSHVFTPQTTSALILAALRRRVPLFGLSTAQVRAGAFAALSCDYADIGKQTAELAARTLRGEDARNIPVSVPRTVSLALNLRTAERDNVTLPGDVEATAREVVR